MLTNEQKQHIKQRVEHYTQQARDLYKAQHILSPRVPFGERGLTAGKAYLARHEVGFNAEIAAHNWEDFDRTIAHEVAHLVAWVLFGDGGHGKPWKRVFSALGFVPVRCSQYNMDNVTVRRQRRYTYVCGCTTHNISATRHNRARDLDYTYTMRCRACKQTLKYRAG